MTSTQKKIFALTLALAAAVFCLFIPPNAAASENPAMVMMFEPDEAATLPYVYKQLAPADSAKHALYNFAFYGFYFYGFPYFAVSGLTMLGLKAAGVWQQTPVVMLALRQVVSVLPLLLGLLVLTGLQDGFRTYRSPLIFAFLCAVPASLGNNFWWHPDGILFLLAVVVLYCLRRDNLRLGRWFFAAAFACGLATAAKLMGVYFFLAVGLVLALAVITKKASLGRAALAAAGFLAVMLAAFALGNPYLISASARLRYLKTLGSQAGLLSEGYGVVYEKGLAAAWPLMREYYGEALFLIAALGAAGWAAWRSRDRLLHALILAWFLPVTAALLWLTHFKFQYWLPAALPLFSSLAALLPERMAAPRLNRSWLKPRLARAALLALALAQLGLYAVRDTRMYAERLTRAENNSEIQFYGQAVAALRPIPASHATRVYYDARLYLPATPGWSGETTTDVLNYDLTRGFDVLLLMEQRIRDYLNPEVTGIDPAAFAESQRFYRDADQGAIDGYRLVYRDGTGLIFVSDEIYELYFRGR